MSFVHTLIGALPAVSLVVIGLVLLFVSFVVRVLPVPESHATQQDNEFERRSRLRLHRIDLRFGLIAAGLVACCLGVASGANAWQTSLARLDPNTQEDKANALPSLGVDREFKLEYRAIDDDKRVVQAVHYMGSALQANALVAFAKGQEYYHPWVQSQELRVATLVVNGKTLSLAPGHWLVRENAKTYVLSREAFAATFEPVTD